VSDKARGIKAILFIGVLVCATDGLLNRSNIIQQREIFLENSARSAAYQVLSDAVNALWIDL
jgi:hypothetical protein